MTPNPDPNADGSRRPVSDPDMEERIRNAASVQPSPELLNSISASLERVPKRRASWIGWLALPAAALALWGVAQWKGGEQGEQGATPGEVAVADALFVIRTQPERDAVVVQETRGFQLQQVREGESFGRDTLQSVAADSLTLLSSSGASREHVVAEINRAAEEQVRAECAGLSALHASGKLSRAQVDRLAVMAEAGRPEAVALLEVLARDEGEFADEALGRLAENRKLQQYERMRDWVLNGSAASRARALDALASDLHSAMALATLTRLGCELTDEAAARRCIDAITKFGDAQAAPALQRIVAGASSEDARLTATAALDHMLEALHESR